MKPEKDNFKEEIQHRLELLESHLPTIDKTSPMYLLSLNEHSIYSEIVSLVTVFGNRLGFENFKTEKYTPIKDYITREPLKIGDKVRASNSDANGTLHFDDYTNQYVIRNEFGQHSKPSNFIKINENFDYSIDNSKVECRPNPHKQKW